MDFHPVAGESEIAPGVPAGTTFAIAMSVQLARKLKPMVSVLPTLLVHCGSAKTPYGLGKPYIVPVSLLGPF